ncbi:hypothetical protein L1276_004874 [Flavobacterium sp. HSC-32F16]|uniref:hypothetical protein n=1 Tax=Flavobacterium sp. HSC-32F16 TaxID=2910964 RepID=UPI0020A56D72|nr:hypothetical protein [Flavobacterium sp. HSC-32F16]MCP2029680.1 hypothetical protein [Flavobacterium sp. HSC-32F16]
MRKSIIIIICFPLFLGCEQISKSINETFSPNDSVVSKQSNSDVKNEVQEVDVQKNINDAVDRHNAAQNQLETKTIVLLKDTNELSKAEETLKKLPQYAGKEIFVYSTLYFYNDGRINVMLQHPENKKYVDAYEYKNGVWSDPKPVQLSIRDEVQKRLVSLNTIRFINAAKVFEIYNKKAEEVEGASPAANVYISIWDNKIKWYPSSINGSRERYSIQFNDDGSLKTFTQD